MRILTGQGRTRDRTGQDKEQKGEHGTMRINYVITSKEQQCDYFALLQAFGVPEDTEDHSVCALQIYDFEPDDLMNDITDFQVKGSHRAIDEDGIPFDVMLPLIDETARKVHVLTPQEAQTGPAVRYDQNVIRAQSSLLRDNPLLKDIYERMSMNIHRMSEEK